MACGCGEGGLRILARRERDVAGISSLMGAVWSSAFTRFPFGRSPDRLKAELQTTSHIARQPCQQKQVGVGLYQTKPSRVKPMRSSAILFEIIEPFARYVCAIFVTVAVAAVISAGAVTVFGYGLMALLSGVVFVGLPSASIAFCAAFTAIYSGSLCLARTNRILVSIMLTVVGVVSYQIFWYTDWQYRIPFYKHGRGSLAPLIALGGVSVCILNSWISRRRLKGESVVQSPVVEKI
jgi:hypothetical protein